jgi:DtxR family Mn-dependent transcriptional regulator
MSAMKEMIAMTEAPPLSASLEDYLEAILHIENEQRAARPKDIAKRLGIGNSSVTGALHALADRGLIHYAPFELVTLTPEGVRLAESVARRHTALKDFFVKVLRIDAEQSDEVACKMEHVASPEVIDRFVAFVHFIENCPRCGTEWIARFDSHCSDDPEHRQCSHCME